MPLSVGCMHLMGRCLAACDHSRTKVTKHLDSEHFRFHGLFLFCHEVLCEMMSRRQLRCMYVHYIPAYVRTVYNVTKHYMLLISVICVFMISGCV